MLPICCYNCGKCISKFEKDFKNKLLKKNKSVEEILNELKINKLCCRTLFLTSINECELLVK